MAVVAARQGRSSAFPRRNSPEFCKACPRENRGRRECRVRGSRPQPCVRIEKAHKQVTTGQAEHRHSLRDGLRLILVLSPVSMTSESPSLAKHLANLVPAQGCQDHTPSPSAFDIARLTMPPASTASRLAFVTTRPPLVPESG